MSFEQTWREQINSQTKIELLNPTVFILSPVGRSYQFWTIPYEIQYLDPNEW